MADGSALAAGAEPGIQPFAAAGKRQLGMGGGAVLEFLLQRAPSLSAVTQLPLEEKSSLRFPIISLIQTWEKNEQNV